MIRIPKEGRAALNWSLFACDYVSSAAQLFQVHCYVSPLVLGVNTTRADLLAAEASWPGYAALPLRSPADVGFDLLLHDVFQFQEVNWTRGSGGVTQTAYGYWVDLLTAGLTRRLGWCEPFPAGVLMRDTGDFLAFTPQFAFGQLPPDAGQYTLADAGLVLAGDGS